MHRLTLWGAFIGWTNAWRIYHVRQGNSHIVIHDLHKKYGPVVRIGPNIVDLDLPELVKTIYNVKESWRKVSYNYLEHRLKFVTDTSENRPNSIMEVVQRWKGKSSTTYSARPILRLMRETSGRLQNTTR